MLKIIKEVRDAYTGYYIHISKVLSIILICWSLLKLVTALYARSVLLLIYAIYSMIMSFAKRTSSQSRPRNVFTNHLICGIIIAVAGLAYIFYAVYVFFNGSPFVYHHIVTVVVLLIALINLPLAFLAFLKAEKKENIQLKTIRHTNLAAALISLNLTLNVILTLIIKDDISFYMALSSIVIGFFVVILGFQMIYAFFHKYLYQYRRVKLS